MIPCANRSKLGRQRRHCDPNGPALAYSTRADCRVCPLPFYILEVERHGSGRQHRYW
ncbi:MAG: hypothetical protein MI923_13055 [Phycisphaerales bacterium]|nr:hypothetical protein [Phycisphaerales bacterium]